MFSARLTRDASQRPSRIWSIRFGIVALRPCRRSERYLATFSFTGFKDDEVRERVESRPDAGFDAAMMIDRMDERTDDAERKAAPDVRLISFELVRGYS